MIAYLDMNIIWMFYSIYNIYEIITMTSDCGVCELIVVEVLIDLEIIHRRKLLKHMPRKIRYYIIIEVFCVSSRR